METQVNLVMEGNGGLEACGRPESLTGSQEDIGEGTAYGDPRILMIPNYQMATNDRSRGRVETA